MSLKMNKDRQALQAWFMQNRRSFPWRDAPSPYGVWISEVMLQQTRASVVISYYQKWMKTFPTLEILAQSSLDKVLKLWEGLGYYSRARNIHEGAQFIVKHFKGNIPKDPDLLKQIKGIGPYTIGAIQSFAFQQKAPAIDGNVTRVITRYFAIQEEVVKVSTKQKIKKKTELFLEGSLSHVTMEALIELGALVCKPLAQCEECPLNSRCLAKNKHLTTKIPNKAKPKKVVVKQRLVLIFQCKDQYAVYQENKRLMKDLYQFPYFDCISKITIKNIKQLVLQNLKGSLHRILPLQKIWQFYTKYKVELHPYLIEVEDPSLSKNYQWVTLSKLKSLPFCSGHRKILHQL